jgi:truncated hemoglobin YjbI
MEFPMLEKIKSWLRMEITKVDDVMHQFYDTITQLERVAQAHAAEAEEHADEILRREEARVTAAAESWRATKLAGKLKDLLG